MELVKEKTETVFNILKIAALVLGGIWTYYMFGQKEAPSLEPRAEVNSGIEWQSSDQNNSCRAIFRVNFKNSGNSSFDIVRIRLRGWTFERDKDSNNAAVFLDIDNIQNFGNSFFDRVYEAEKNQDGSLRITPFTMHYPPETSYNHTYEWDIKRMLNKWICFRIEFYVNGETENPKWLTSSWDRICFISEKENSNKENE